MNRCTELFVACLLALVLVLGTAPVAEAKTEGFQTLTWDASPAVTGQPLTFRFGVFHPDPNAVVTSGQIIFTREAWEGLILTHEFVGAVPITGTDIGRETDPNPEQPKNTFVWPECTFMPGDYEWHVLVTVAGETNTAFDAPEIRVYPPVSINDRATFTRSTAAKVTYFHRPTEKYFQISNSLSDWPEAWQEIPAEAQTLDWTLGPSVDGDESDGERSVYMRFAETPGGPATAWSDAITLDRTGPVTKAPEPSTVTKGRDAKLKYGATDLICPDGTFTIKIRTLGGRLVKTLTCGWQTMWQAGWERPHWHMKQFRCTLSRGTYRFSAYATDTAGNRQSQVGSNKLIVK
jgi:hypothetical protein